MRTRTLSILVLVLLAGGPWVAPAQGGELRGMALQVPTGASAACPGRPDVLARRLGDAVRGELSAAGLVRVAEGAPAKAELVLSTGIGCNPGTLTWMLNLIAPGSAEVLWSKSFEASGPTGLEASVPEAARLLAAFLKEGKRPDEVEPAGPARGGAGPGSLLFKRRIVCVPLAASLRGKLPPQALRALDDQFVRALRERAGAEVETVDGELDSVMGRKVQIFDRILALELAYGFDAELGLLVELDPRPGGCALSGAVFGPKSKDPLKAVSVPCPCDPAGVTKGLDALVTALAR